MYLNYPRPNGRRVAIVEPPELRWEAQLEEDKVSDDPKQHQTLAFHGHSRSGNVTGKLVYANYGSREDFAWLKEQGIDVKDSIVLVRYYGTQGDRALKVKAAELAGAAGCLIYSDPMEDGFRRGKVWPDGPWRPNDSIQRGAVSMMSWIVGDVLTPGWASTPDAKRISKDNNPGLVNIPSLPLASRAGRRLLQSLKGKGIAVNDDWRGGIPDVEWWTGDETSPIIHLMNLQDEVERQTIRNVIAKIDGYETPEKTIWVGNHRDAWCFGAVDPGTGTAVMLEVARIFGELSQQGWTPRRTIVFASWDGEEYNLIGSTEHVEEHINAIRQDAVAYLNVDVGVAGDKFRASASPVFRKALLQVLGRVSDTENNRTLAQLWKESNSQLEGLGAGSDYVAFQDLAGCSSIDFGFEGKKHGFPYHSCYESYEYVERVIDPNFDYHHMLVQVWALLILELSDSAILPFDMPFYASEIKRYVEQLKLDAASIPGDDHPDQRLRMDSLEEAAELFIRNAAEFATFEENWKSSIMANGMMESRELTFNRWAHNARMSNFETHLLDLPMEEEGREGGVPGRTQFKHVIFGPQAWSGYDEAFFPAIRDALDERRWADAQKQLEIVAGVIKFAATKLLN